MWHNVRLLNAIASALVALVVLAALAAGGHWLIQRPVFTLKALVEGDGDAANTVSNNGIDVEDNFDDVTIAGNTITGAANNGIYLTDVGGVNVSSNLITGSGANGFFLAGPYNDSVSLSGNTFTGNPTGARFESGLVDLTGDFRHIRHAVHRAQQTLLRVVRKNGRRLLVIGDQTRLHRLGIVIRPPHEIVAAALVAGPLDLRPVELVVIAGPALRASEPAGNPLDQRRVIDLQLDDLVDLPALAGQHAQERRPFRYG